MRRIRKMTAKQKKLFLLTSMMSVFVMAVTVLFVGGKISMSPLSVRGGTEEVNGSITWSWSGSQRTKHANNKYSFLSRTQRGTGIYLYSYGYGNQGSDKIWSSKYNTSYPYGLFISAEAGSSSLFEFQSITSISIVTKSSSESGATFAIYGGGTDTTPLTSKTIMSPGQTLSYTPSSTMKYLSINATNGYWVDIESITVNYSCTYDGGADPDPSEGVLSSISVSGQSTSYIKNDIFSFDGIVTAHYSNGASANVTSSATFSGYDLSTLGSQTVTVSYTEDDITKTTSYTISVVNSMQVYLTGTYSFTGRTRAESSTSPIWNDMTISFTAGGSCTWENDRVDGYYKYKCKVFYDYVAIDDGSSITVSLTVCDGEWADKFDYQYSYNDGPWYSSTSAGYFSGGSYDRPANKGITVSGAANEATMERDKESFTISVYEYKNSSYSYYDTFTFEK